MQLSQIIQDNILRCPICSTELIQKKEEIKKGVYAIVEICPKCKEEWTDETEFDKYYENYNLFKRKAFTLGGSIAIRIPKEIANALNIKKGTELSIKAKDKKLIVEAN